jgi:hypothetical protein
VISAADGNPERTETSKSKCESEQVLHYDHPPGMGIG